MNKETEKFSGRLLRMTLLKFVLGGLIILSFGACDVRKAIRSQAQLTKEATASLPLAREFRALFPSHIVRLASGHYGDSLVLRTGLYDRYELLMQIKFTVDESGKIAARTEPPAIILKEIEAIAANRIDYNSEFEPGRLTLAQWDDLVSGRSLPEIVPSLKTNAPVPGFREWWEDQFGDIKL